MSNMPPPVGDSAKQEPSAKKKWYKKWWVWLLVVLVVGGISSAGEDQQSSSDSKESSESAPSESTTAESVPAETTEAPVETVPDTTIPETTVAVSKSSQQESFVAAIEEGRTKIEDASTDLQESAALRDRDKALCSALSSYVATDWTGEVKNIGANGEGKAYITIEIAEDARVKTWNNAFSDSSDKTLIPESSPIFSQIVPLDKGDKVKFSAKFLRGRDTCLKQGNLTEYFYGRDPEFIVQFTKIEPSN
jgi:hypothetical protein